MGGSHLASLCPSRCSSEVTGWGIPGLWDCLSWAQCGGSDSASRASSGLTKKPAPGCLCLWGEWPCLPVLFSLSWSQPRVAPLGGGWGLGGPKTTSDPLPDSRYCAVVRHLFLEAGFCFTQHLWFSMDSETFNKYLASCFKMF